MYIMVTYSTEWALSVYTLQYCSSVNTYLILTGQVQ